MIRVFIERRLAPGMEDRFHAVMREMRREAVHRPGYISGETLQDADDQRHSVVVSSWKSRRDWDLWSASESRQVVRRQIAPLLTSPETVTVLEPV